VEEAKVSIKSLQKDFNVIADQLIVIQEKRRGDEALAKKNQDFLDIQSEVNDLKSKIDSYKITLKDFEEEKK